METLTMMDEPAAQKLLRHLTPLEALEAGILTPMAGTRPVRLFSLEEAERFLVKYDKEAVDFNGTWAQINYVDPEHLAQWVIDILGDEELGNALHEVAASREAYGFLVPTLKGLIQTRIEQAKVVLGISESDTE